MPAGADVALEAVLTVDGAASPQQATSSGVYTLSIENTVSPLQSILTDELSDAFTASSGLARWNITDTQTSVWPAGTFDGDIKMVDSGGSITYWPVSIKIRSVVD